MSEALHLGPLVREAFDPVATQHGFEEVGHVQENLVESVTYANRARVLRFELDTREGYLDVRYGPQTILHRLGGELLLDYTRAPSLFAQMEKRGLDVPYGPQRLYRERQLATAVAMMVDEVQRRATELMSEDVWE